MQLFISCQQLHALEVESSEDLYTLKEFIEEVESVPADEQVLYCNGRPLNDEDLFGDSDLKEGDSIEVCLRLKGGKVHGSLARAGKVKGQTPKVEKAEGKKKKKTGRAKRRALYNKRFLNIVPSFGRRRGPNTNQPA